MIKRCSSTCEPICSFCIHFEHNYENGYVYTNCGFCKLHFLPTDIIDDCEYFECINFKKALKHSVESSSRIEGINHKL